MLGWNLGQMGSSLERDMVILERRPARSLQPHRDTSGKGETDNTCMTYDFVNQI